jgi:hypothetical protein
LFSVAIDLAPSLVPLYSHDGTQRIIRSLKRFLESDFAGDLGPVPSRTPATRIGQNGALHQQAWQERTLTVVRNETRQLMRQDALTLNPAAKRLEARFATAIMAEKRQELSQTTGTVCNFLW